MKLFGHLVILASLALSGHAFAATGEEPLSERFFDGSGDLVVSKVKSLTEFGEPSAEFSQVEHGNDGEKIGYLSGEAAPTLQVKLTTPPLVDNQNSPVVIFSIDAEVTLKDGFGDIIFKQTLALNPYREKASAGSNNLLYTSYTCLLVNEKISSFEYDRYCLQETEARISQKQFNYMNERFGGSSRNFRAEAKIRKVWLSDGSTFDSRRGYARPVPALTKGHSSLARLEGQTVKSPDEIKSIKDAFSHRNATVNYQYLEGENYAYVMPTGVLHNHTGKRVTGIEARLIIYSSRGEVVFDRVLRSEVDETYRDNGAVLVGQMYFDQLTANIFPAVQRAIDTKNTQKMDRSDFIDLIKLSSRLNYRANVEPLGARFEDGTGVGTLRN